MGTFFNLYFEFLLPMSIHLAQSSGHVFCLKCAFRASYIGNQLFDTLSHALKKTIEALFKEIELFRDCPLITII